MSPYNQAKIDRTMIELDGTPNKAKLGANAILGVSMAVARAAAHSKHEPLYRYLGGCDLELPQTFHNVINGGKHADNGIDIQEFMITPVKKTSFRDGFEKIVNTYHTLKKVIEEAGFETGLGDEGGFAPNLKSSEEALKMLHEAIEKPGTNQVKILLLLLTQLPHPSITKKMASTTLKVMYGMAIKCLITTTSF